MSARVYVGWFEDEERTLAATAAARQAGFELHDVYTPYAVHGIDRAMGLKPTRLTWACLGGGLAGLLIATWLQLFISVQSWPHNIGGKPPASMPAFVPLMFELTVLFGAVCSVLALFFIERLFPGASARALPGVTDDRFAVAISTSSRARFDAEEAGALLTSHGAVSVGFEEVDR